MPTILTSTPSAGKSLLLTHLAHQLQPGVSNPIVIIHLADTSLDARSLLGSYTSSPTQPGVFEWREGVLVRAMREGRWVVLSDVDRGSSDVLGTLKPLVDSLGPGGWIGAPAMLEVPGRGRVEAHPGFALFATRSTALGRGGDFAKPVFFGTHKFAEVIVPTPSPAELQTIVDARFPRLAGTPARAVILLWQDVRALGTPASARDVGVRELQKFCTRLDFLLPATYQPPNAGGGMDVDALTLADVFPQPALREEMFAEARDVFFGASALNSAAKAYMDAAIALCARHIGLDADRQAWILTGRRPAFEVETSNGQVRAVVAGHVRLPARVVKEIAPPTPARPFAMHKPAANLLARIATAVALAEPVLLTGETGTGKTSAVTHLASTLRRPLVSLNLSHQTEGADLIGGFRPLDARVPAARVQEKFLELFGATFSRKKNVKFEDAARGAVAGGKWKRAVALWKEAVRLARERFQAKQEEHPCVPRPNQVPFIVILTICCTEQMCWIWMPLVSARRPLAFPIGSHSTARWKNSICSMSKIRESWPLAS
jgi:midasin